MSKGFERLRIWRELSFSYACAFAMLVVIALGLLFMVTTKTGYALNAELRGSAYADTRSSSGIDYFGSSSFYTNCRFGLALVSDPLTSYAIPPLNLGWYLDWSSQLDPQQPNGIEYAQMVRVGTYGYTPSDHELSARVAANPGSIWLIGNEPDSPVQDNVTPEIYARRYYEAYHTIKGSDPTARVAVGGIVQPTPVRMVYLDRMLRAYSERYGHSLPTDAWHIHSFILREISLDYAIETGEDYWGAEIPPGISVPYGELYDLYEDTDDIDIFESRLQDFRRWMRDRGYRDRPLLITEYGTLIPYYYFDQPEEHYGYPDNVFDEVRAARFMTETFDYLLNATDPRTGYPADNNRLVQRWVWYSSDDPDNGGLLFDPQTKEPMMLAQELHTYTASLTPTGDLLVASIDQIDIPLSSGLLETATLRVKVSNAGNIAVDSPFNVHVTDVDSGDPIVERLEIREALLGCGDSLSFLVQWPNLSPGAHSIRVEIDPVDALPERSEHNNARESMVLIASSRLYLPVVWR